MNPKPIVELLDGSQNGLMEGDVRDMEIQRKAGQTKPSSEANRPCPPSSFLYSLICGSLGTHWGLTGGSLGVSTYSFGSRSFVSCSTSSLTSLFVSLCALALYSCRMGLCRSS